MVGGAIGYVSYDCIKYFEPKTERPLKDPLGIPEAVLMLHDPVIAFDNLYQIIKVISHVSIPPESSNGELELAYNSTVSKIRSICDILNSPEVPKPVQPPVVLD